MVDTRPGAMLFVKFKSSLPKEEVERRYRERMPEFRRLEGLVQKYYVYDPQTEEWGGVYLWDSRESLDAFFAGELRKSIPTAYEVVGSPRLDIVEIIEPLRK